MGYDWGEQLFSSPHRLEVLQQLRSDPADTQTLTERLSISRVTVQRHLNRCSELGWIRKADGRYELTSLGEHVCEAAATFLDRLSTLEEHEDVIDALGAIDGAFDPRLLVDATVSVAEPNDPHEPIIHYRNAMSETTTDSIRGILPVFSELLVDVHRDLLVDGVETELVAPRPVHETGPPVDEIPSSAFTLYVLDRPLEFGVTLTDETAFVGTYDDGTFAACVESSEPAFREWVAGVYETYRERASRVPLETGRGDAEPELDSDTGSERDTDSVD